MATADCVEALVDQTEHILGESAAKDWKRLSKRNVKLHPNHTGVLREFEHKPSGRRFFYQSYVDEDDDGEFIESGEFLYALSPVDVDDFSAGLMLSVTPKAYWDSVGAIYDQHMSGWLDVLFGLNEDKLSMDEVCENMIMLETDDMEAVEAILNEAGLVRSPEIEAFLIVSMSK